MTFEYNGERFECDEMNPSATKAKVDLHGGPLDGFKGRKAIIVQPGKFPLFVHRGHGGKRYVYQATRFLEDFLDTGDSIYMDFAQIIFKDDEL